MAEHQGFMLMYSESAGKYPGIRFVAPLEDFQKLMEKARTFVGEHSDIDGCSTKAQMYKHGEIQGIVRNSSFGTRRAEIERLPILRE